MASQKTKLTELGTAVGLVLEPDARWPDDLRSLQIPGLASEQWQPVVCPAASGPAGPDRDLVLRAIDNGRAFRRHVLHGRRPAQIEWTGGDRATWPSDIPRDLTVDGVWFIQAKYDSRCVLNTSPASLVDELLAEDDVSTRRSWYAEVAGRELQAYYRLVRDRAVAEHGSGLLTDGAPPQLPDDVRDLTTVGARTLRDWLQRSHDPAVDAAYAELGRAVSIETARRWQHRLRASHASGRTRMLFRMLRIAGGPYWLLGAKGAAPLRLAVTDTRTWRRRFELRHVDVVAGRAGQPQVDWRAIVHDLGRGSDRAVEGYCELRWSHGKLSGNPECKVQVTTPLADIPGYDPLESTTPI